MAKHIYLYDIFINFVSLITFMLDVGTDVLVTVEFFERGDIVWGCLTAGFVGIPTIIIQLFSLKWHISDKTLSLGTCLPHLFLFSPVQRYLRVIRLSLKARSTRSFYDIDRVYREQNDVCILRLIESFLEATPQLCLQLYVILITNNITVIAGVSVVSSLISLSWALTAYSDGLRLAYRDSYARNWCSLIVHWLWQTSMIMARVMALVVFATVFQAWVFLFVGVHWLAMTIGISIKGTDFGDGPCERVLFQIVAGFIYIFCFLNLTDGRSRYRMLAYYTVIFLENTVLVAVWFAFCDYIPYMSILTPSVVFGGFLLGLFFLMLYYRCLHPSGPVYLFTVKPAIHNGVLNNQLEPRPRIFDVTQMTPISVLGSDIIELSRDLDHTTLSISRTSYRSSATFSQQNLQLIWDQALIARSSSSDSSLDMMDPSVRRGTTYDGTLSSSRSASSTKQLLQNSGSIWGRERRLRDQADRRDEMYDSLASTTKRTPAGNRFFTEKDIYGFHESRFMGTYYSPMKKSCQSLNKPEPMSPLDAAKLWDETVGRVRSPLIYPSDDSFSTLDASDLLDTSYHRNRSIDRSSCKRMDMSHDLTVKPELHNKPSFHGLEQPTTFSDTNATQNYYDDCDDHYLQRMNYMERNLSKSNLSSGLGKEKVKSKDGNISESLESLPDYSHFNYLADIGTSTVDEPVYESLPQDHFRAGATQTPQDNRVYCAGQQIHGISLSGTQLDYEVSENEESEDESGVYTSTSNKSERKSLQFPDMSVQNSPSEVYPVRDRCSFQGTQSAPGLRRHTQRTGSDGFDIPRLQYTETDDLPAACEKDLPDTPWRLDYLNLEPLKTVLAIENFPEDKKQLVKKYLQNINESLIARSKPSPLKVQEFQDSPNRLGRNIDLFNSHAWHENKKTTDDQNCIDSDGENDFDVNPRSRKSLHLNKSGESRRRPLSGDSGFQRSYIDAENARSETSPFGMYRHSAKLSTIRGSDACSGPVRGSPRPVRNKSKDRTERRSREMDQNPAPQNSQLHTGRYTKRTSAGNQLKRRSNPSAENLSLKKCHEAGTWSPQSKNFNVPVYHAQTDSAVSECPSFASSYRQAIYNTSRPVVEANYNRMIHSEMRLEDLVHPSSKPRQAPPARRPFQAIQNTPSFSPIGSTRHKTCYPSDLYSSTPKHSSNLHGLALVGAYNSPEPEVQNDWQNNKCSSRPRQEVPRGKNMSRTKSVDCIR